MPAPNIDSFWKPSFDTLYDAYFYELSSEALIRRWQSLHMTTACVAAATTSGSAISGWAFWSDPNGRVIWGILAGFASFISIVHSTLSVPRKIKEEEERRRLFSALRVDLESFRHNLVLVPDGTLAQKQFTSLRQRLSDNVSKTPSDIVFTSSLRKTVQLEVNSRLNKYISHE